MPTNRSRTGGALLMVMWMSAALAAIAFSLATSVRGETDHTSTTVDDLRSYYLATGGIQRAIMDMQQPGEVYRPGQPRLMYEFPTGSVTVEIIPETAKLNINTINDKRLLTLLTALGVDDAGAQSITRAIIDSRTPSATGAGSSFAPRQASFQEIEELLTVPGITPDLFYGTYVRDTSMNPPQLVAKGGLKECLSVYGTMGSLDINGAAPAAMAAMGVSPEVVNDIVARRPFLAAKDFGDFMMAHPGTPGLQFGGFQMYTLRATARLRGANGTLSDLRRTVAETVDFQPNLDPPLVVLRWYDHG